MIREIKKELPPKDYPSAADFLWSQSPCGLGCFPDAADFSFIRHIKIAGIQVMGDSRVRLPK